MWVLEFLVLLQLANKEMIHITGLWSATTMVHVQSTNKTL